MRKSQSKWVVLAAFAMAGAPAQAQLQATSSEGWTGNAGLVFSKVKATVGPQWIDVEEEAALSAESIYGGSGPWLVEGNFNVPTGTVVTGCLLWNADTLLMGKLRGKADAEHVFDSLVRPPPKNYRFDPLLIEQTGDSTYHLQLFPIADGGNRVIRIRYLVPVTSTTGDVPLLPVLSQAVTGTKPASWTLTVRGTTSNLKLYHDNAWFPLSPPTSRSMDFATCGAVRMRWASMATDGSRAIRGKIDSGAWGGDYVLFTGKVPDSIGRRLDIHSETVFLWRWIQPQSFFANDYYGNRYINNYGQQVIDQARKIVDLSGQLTGNGNKVGLVADQGMDDSSVVFPLSDSTGSDFRRMNTWLDGIDATYLLWRIPASAGSSSGSGNLDLAKNRQSFRADVRTVGALYSKDSGIVRHLVVVTVGQVPSGGDLQELPDLSGLPATVSVASSQILQASTYGCGYTYYGYYTCSNGDGQPAISNWPGVDLNGVVAARKGLGTLDSVEGVPLPKIRTSIAASLSMTTSQGVQGRDVVIQRGPDGSWMAGLNLQAKGIGQQVNWLFFDDSANVVGSWAQTPAWTVVDGDSVLPRLWANSKGRITPNFSGTTTLAPIFGFVDRQYSLLATPTDSMGRARQVAYADSGVPFLSARDIFFKTGYGSSDNNSGNSGNQGAAIRTLAKAKSGLAVSLMAGLRKVRIEFTGLDARSIEVRDIRGHKVADWNQQALAGRTSVVWSGRNLSGDSAPGGLYIVVLKAASRTWTVSVALP